MLSGRGAMPPPLSERWPASVYEAFAEINELMAQGRKVDIAKKCKHVLKLLRDLQRSKPDDLVSRQIAYAYFDLTEPCEHIGQIKLARQAFVKARDLWTQITDADPRDFEARSELAACRNHLGLMALAAGKLAEAELELLAALASRRVLSFIAPDHPDQPMNLVYLAGCVCNLGHVHIERGERDEALRCYDESIRLLGQIVPTAHDPIEQEICELWQNAQAEVEGVPHWIPLAQQYLASAAESRARAARE